jgi:uncharacterized protein
MIYKLEEGVFYSQLVCNNGKKEYTIDSRTSDAVAIALRFGCPIYISEDILEKAQLTNTPSDTELTIENGDEIISETASPYSSYTDEELYKMIDEAVKTEDYERAAAIRDEIDKRKKKSH